VRARWLRRRARHESAPEQLPTAHDVESAALAKFRAGQIQLRPRDEVQTLIDQLVASYTELTPAIVDLAWVDTSALLGYLPYWQRDGVSPDAYVTVRALAVYVSNTVLGSSYMAREELGRGLIAQCLAQPGQDERVQEAIDHLHQLNRATWQDALSEAWPGGPSPDDFQLTLRSFGSGGTRGLMISHLDRALRDMARDIGSPDGARVVEAVYRGGPVRLTPEELAERVAACFSEQDARHPISRAAQRAAGVRIMSRVVRGGRSLLYDAIECFNTILEDRAKSDGGKGAPGPDSGHEEG